MKFFTAEIVNRWNSELVPDEQWEQEDQEWRENLEAYGKHIKRISDRLPDSVLKFVDLVLHDEDVVAMPRAVDFDGRVVGYKHGDDYSVVTHNPSDRMLHVMTYVIEKPPTIRIHEGSGFTASDLAVWLYDELDIDEAGLFTHSVLFSNGIELTVMFSAMHWQECQIQKEG